MRDARARGEKEEEGRQIGIAQDPVAAAIEGPRPETEGGETIGGLGRPRETRGIGRAEIGRPAPTGGTVAKEAKYSASRTADERNEDRKGLT